MIIDAGEYWDSKYNIAENTAEIVCNADRNCTQQNILQTNTCNV